MGLALCSCSLKISLPTGGKCCKKQGQFKYFSSFPANSIVCPMAAVSAQAHILEGFISKGALSVKTEAGPALKELHMRQDSADTDVCGLCSGPQASALQVREEQWPCLVVVLHILTM